MKRRLIIGIAAAALVAAMLPGVAQAVPDPDKKRPTFEWVTTCQHFGVPNSELVAITTGPAGVVQSEVARLRKELAVSCLDRPVVVSRSRIP